MRLIVMQDKFVRHQSSFCVHTRGDGLKKERTRREMNEQIRNMFRGHHLQYAGVEEMLIWGTALWLGHLWRMMFVWCLQLVWPAVFHWQSGRTVARLVLSKLSQCQELCVLPEGIFFFKWSSNQKLTFVTLCQSCVQSFQIKENTCHCVRRDLDMWGRGCCLYMRKAATTLLVPWETGMVSSPHSSPSPFLPHPLAVSPPFVKEACEQGRGRAR